MNDLISRHEAIDAIHEDADWLAAQGSDWQVERMERDKSILMSLPSAESEHLVKESGDLVKDLVNDCISRKDAIDAIRNIIAITGTFDDEILLIDKAQAQTELMMLPSASSDLSTFSDKLWKIAYERGKEEGRKKGKWLETSEDWRNQITWWQCSLCGTPSSYKSNFCPNCGSYNGGEADETD